MAPEPASRRGGGGDDTHMKLLCSHGGRFFHPCGPDVGGEPRYVGGETRVLVLPRAVSFRDLAARLAGTVAGGGGSATAEEQARAITIRHRLADDEGLEDVLVTVTCDEEVAHMRDEYDRLRATRPAARFRVFVTTTAAPSSAAGPKRATTTTGGLPPLAPPPPSMRRVQSEQAVAARAQQHQKHRPLTRRVHSAQELAGGVYTRIQSSFHHQHCCCCCSCQRRGRYTPAPPARPTYAMPYMSKKKVAAAPPKVSAAEAAAVSTEAAATREKAMSRGVETAVQNRRAIWELE